MNTEAIEKSLSNFQKACEKKIIRMGYASEISNSVFSFIVEMRNMMIAVEKRNTHDLHKHMGFATQALSNFASTNNIKLSDCLTRKTFVEIAVETDKFDFEHYLEIIKEDLNVSTKSEMNDKDKIKYIQKGFISIFPEDYFNDFIKIDRVFSNHITNYLQ